MLLLRHVAIATTIQASEINDFKEIVLNAVNTYVDVSTNPVVKKQCRDEVVHRFLALRNKGLSVSMLFFVAPLFMEASLAKNTGREEAVAKLLEDCSWVYSRKALVVLRDVVASPSGPGSTDAIDTSYYVSLKATFKHYLAAKGDPEVVSRPMTMFENAAAVFGAGPSSLQRLTLDSVSPVSVELPSKDSSLFETITKYLDLEVTASTAKALQSSREALESELESKTIYSRRLLHIIGGRLSHLGVRLEDFLSSEYTSIRPKIVKAIVNSQNLVAWKTLLKVPTLSFDLEEDRSFRVAALLKISTKETSLGDFLRTVLDSAQGRPFCQMVFQSESVTAALKMAVLEKLNSDNIDTLLPSVRGELVAFLAECINSPNDGERHLLPKLHVSLMKEILTDLCVSLKIKENLRYLVDLIVLERERDLDADSYAQASRILEAFSGPFRTMFQQELILLMMDLNSETLFNGYSPDGEAAYYELSDSHAVFFYQAKTSVTVLERFSGVNGFSADAQSHIVSLCRMSGLSVDMGLLLPRVFLEKFLDISCDSKFVQHLQGGASQELSFWGDLITKGYFNTRCQDMGRFEQKLADLQKMNTEYPNTYPLKTMVRFAYPDRIVESLRQFVDPGSDCLNTVLMATLDSLWVTNIPIRDICALIKLYETNWNDGAVMVSLR